MVNGCDCFQSGSYLDESSGAYVAGLLGVMGADGRGSDEARSPGTGLTQWLEDRCLGKKRWR